MYHSNANVKKLKHYKKFEQTEFELKQTVQISMLNKVTKGIVFSSSDETTIRMKWNKEGVPTLNDIHIEFEHSTDYRGPIYVSGAD